MNRNFKFSAKAILFSKFTLAIACGLFAFTLSGISHAQSDGTNKTPQTPIVIHAARLLDIETGKLIQPERSAGYG